MGTLCSSLKSKYISRDGNKNFSVGTATMQGLRVSQEDAHKIDFSLEAHPELSFFGVFDGHGGPKTSEYLENNILQCLNENKILDTKSIVEALLKLDKKFIDESSNDIREQGSTCVFSLVEKKLKDDGTFEYDITCVNVGDSRCLLIQKDGNWKPLSNDHKPNNEVEFNRIKLADGYVTSQRVDGTLAVSRAFGDYNFKSNPNINQRLQKVIAEPEIIRATCQEGDLMLVSCDGVFEALESGHVANFISNNFFEHKDPGKMLSQVFEAAQKAGSADNMTGILVHFANGEKLVKGGQFVPGPLFHSKNEQQFVKAYREDLARWGMTLSPLVKLVAFHQDLTEIAQDSDAASEVFRGQILEEINRLNPWSISVEDLAFLINSLNASVMISQEDLEKTREAGVLSVEELRDRLDKGEVAELGLSDDIINNVSVLFSVWKGLAKNKIQNAAAK